MSKCRPSMALPLLLLISVSPQFAKANSIIFAGALSSDSTAVSSSDPVITNPNVIHLGDPFSILLTYDPSSFTQPVSNAFLLTNASLTLSFDGFSFVFSSAAGNFLEFANPGAFGPGTASFLICSSASCADDFMNLYFVGSVTSLATLASQAGGLTGDPNASPSEFEFLRNFSDGSQTDLMGTLGTPTVVPEPATLSLFVSGLAAVGVLRRRRRSQA